ncbi:unnamed protein product [Rotaria magnacalcarata]|uniref:Uncharacterized protein n=1 Tax=Rotaria magnacalcarata TaxID=392030 RepID=A0A8S2IVJ1_9BILA|nr:unnamed protein product [Rotaria magnacalcarata]
MLLSTRDAQRAGRSPHFILAAATTQMLNSMGIDKPSLQSDPSSNSHILSQLSKLHFQLPQLSPADEQAIIDVQQLTSPVKRKFHWEMTYYFYIHMCVFIINGLLGGLIVCLIENYSSVRNRQIEVAFIDAWFTSSSCVYGCGLITLDFAKLSRASQIILMAFTFIPGNTISTLPALIIKAAAHKNVEGRAVDDDNSNVEEQRDELPILDSRAQLRYRAYIACIVLILVTCFAIYAITFVAIGGWLTTQYTPEQLLQENSSVNPWYTSFIITVTGFNQNGLTPFSDDFARFVSDVYLNLFAALIVICGTSLFPYILRNVVLIVRRLSPWRHKVIFDYVLLNNHRLSTLLFPTLQTRIYLFITLLLYILVNTRFAGFASIDVSLLSTATLLVYLLLMANKPQMLCALDETPFELSWLALETQEKVDAETKPMEKNYVASDVPASHNQLESIESGPTRHALPVAQMHQFFHRRITTTTDQARVQFASTTTKFSAHGKTRRLKYLRNRLFFFHFTRTLRKNAITSIILTRTWLIFFIFRICAIEYRQMAPADPNITLLKIIFETMSAFGTVGLSLGYPNIVSSFATVLSPASKVILIATMLMGRHRGLLASMKDQETIEYSAFDLLNRERLKLICEYEKTTLGYISKRINKERISSILSSTTVSSEESTCTAPKQLCIDVEDTFNDYNKENILD